MALGLSANAPNLPLSRVESVQPEANTGAVFRQQVTWRAIWHQAFTPIGKILRDMGYMNTTQFLEVVQTLPVEKMSNNRFGALAIQKGFITEEQLVEAMAMAIELDTERANHRTIGSILYNMGYMTIDQITETAEALSEERAKEYLMSSDSK